MVEGRCCERIGGLLDELALKGGQWWREGWWRGYYYEILRSGVRIREDAGGSRRNLGTGWREGWYWREGNIDGVEGGVVLEGGGY